MFQQTKEVEHYTLVKARRGAQGSSKRKEQWSALKGKGNLCLQLAVLRSYFAGYVFAS